MILFVSGEYPPETGGVGDYTSELRRALADQGWPTGVLSRRDVRRWDARSIVRLMRALRRGEPGVVHIQFQAAAYDLLGDVCLMPLLIRRLRRRLRTATTFHDVGVPYLFPHAGRLRAAAVRLLARTSDVVISADQRDLRILGGPSPRHWHVPIGPNVRRCAPAGYEREAFRKSLGLSRGDLAVVYFGFLNASKGLDTLANVFSLVKERSPRARLLLLGGRTGASDPTDRHTAARFEARLASLRDALVQPGWLPAPELSAYLLAGDVAVLPYGDGASGRRGSLLACAEHGLPIVSTQPAANEVAPYISAVPNDAAALAEAVLEAYAAPTTLRAASRALAERTCWPRIAADHVDIYRRLLDLPA